MTLIIKNSEVIHTDSTKMSVGGQVQIRGKLHNSGSIKVYENGSLTVNKDVINTGDLIVNDPETIKELLLELVKTTGSVSELGTQVLKTFFGVKI